MKNTNKIKFHKNKKGFSLVETLVALSVFSIVLTISMGVILYTLDANKKQQALNSVVNNLNYSIESMLRDIKTGHTYGCNINMPNINTFAEYKTATIENNCDDYVDGIFLISTISGFDQIVSYNLIRSVDEEENDYIQKTIYDLDNQNENISYKLTDDINVQIENIKFKVDKYESLFNAGTLSENIGQPGVFVIINGLTGILNLEATRFFIQTYISQRLPNIL